MKIIANPPYRIPYKKFKSVISRATEWSLLHTFTFCNNVGQLEVVHPEEWPEVTVATAIAIAASDIPFNREVKPNFFMKRLSKDDPRDGWLANTNVCYTRPINKGYKQLKLRPVVDSDFIAKSTNKYIKRGEEKRCWVVPDMDYSQFEEQIFMDSYKWAKRTVYRCPLIREEFIKQHGEFNLCHK